jgi:hypothetical protein
MGPQATQGFCRRFGARKWLQRQLLHIFTTINATSADGRAT